jgi:integrase
LMRDMRPSYVPHGFRSTFKDWCAETTNYPNIVSEMALAHKISDETEAAYRRGDLLDKRRRLMRDWARFCTTKPAEASAKVVSIRKAQSA